MTREETIGGEESGSLGREKEGDKGGGQDEVERDVQLAITGRGLKLRPLGKRIEIRRIEIEGLARGTKSRRRKPISD